jgi:hypothetical protein
LRVVLEVTGGAEAGKAITLQAGDVVRVGRATGADFVVAQDGSLSSVHFALDWRGPECCLLDLESRNGTRLNGRRVTEARVRDGDEIAAGQTRFVIRLEREHRVAELAAGPQAAVALERARDPTRPDAAASDAEFGAIAPPAAAGVPLLEVANETPFPVAMLRWEDPEGQARLSVVVKATYSWRGGLRPVAAQPPLTETDEHYGDPVTSSVRFESDLVPTKPRADVVVVGHAHAPGRTPVAQLAVGLVVGRLRHALAVFGDRTWQWQRVGAPTISAPVPFLSMPLTYERAFGGFDVAAGLYCPENLHGTGFIGKRARESVDGVKLPNVEDPRALIRAWNTHPRPAGLGCYGRGCLPRLAQASTPAFFNAAHPDLQVDGWLRGDEEVELINLCSEPRVRFFLPGLRPRITVSRWTVPPERWIDEHADAGGVLPLDRLPLVHEEVTPVLDTLVFVPDEGLFYEVFRASCGLDSVESLEIARIAVGAAPSSKRVEHAG